MPPYDAVILLSFGGPERPEDVIPFLENVTRGRNVPRQRLEEVAEHYYHFGGQSPLNAQNRALLAALVEELNRHGPHVPVYWGNRNWHPLLPEALQQMADDGIRRALAFVTSAFGSYSGCRQYLEDIERAREAVGPGAPAVDKLRQFYNHPGFIEPMAEHLVSALAEVPPERRDAAQVVFTAHSLPTAMARASPYEGQLQEACRLVAERAGVEDWHVAYQSRSGAPSQPWLEPDVADLARSLHESTGLRDLVVVPIGFLSEHMEVIYDLDVELAQLCEQMGVNLVRSKLAGTHPRFVRMIRELIVERTEQPAARLSLGGRGPAPDMCAADCCPPPSALRAS